MYVVCSDLEGIFTPEIWIEFAEKTGIPELRLTTRDIADYDELMRGRLSILNERGFTLRDIQEVVATMEPLEGAVEFLDWLRSQVQVIIVSDTYEEFARPLMAKLKWPTLLCHDLTVAPDGTIRTYNLRQRNGKAKALMAFKGLNYDTIGIGDSYNDIDMLLKADRAILFRPPANVVSEFPQLPVCTGYDDLRGLITEIMERSTA